jgi:hypothetical protein
MNLGDPTPVRSGAQRGATGPMIRQVVAGWQASR